MTSTSSVQIPEKQKRSFLKEDFEVKNWEGLKPYYEALFNREINSAQDLRQWLLDRSELESAVGEDAGWRFINMTRDTTDKEVEEKFNFFVQEIEPQIAPYNHELNKKVLDAPYWDELDLEGKDILKRELEKDVEIYREENIPLNTELQTESQKFGSVAGAMTVEVDGEEKTLSQAADYLLMPDREKREEVYRKIWNRRLQDREQLDQLYDHLIDLRHKVAKNAGFENFRDYMFRAMGRFDYKPEDCFQFHDSVSEVVQPVLDELATHRKKKLGVDELRPWDMGVDPANQTPLKPFNTSEELISKSAECFSRIDPFLGNCLSVMNEIGHLDLESRKGKAPGGYNYPLDEVGVPFIFMNATSTLRDMVTLMHEGGHAVHSFLTREKPLNFVRHTPSEVSELASMSMELISMDHWDVFFDSEEDLRRAKEEHLEGVIQTLPWVATVDQFQHWVYENPGHTVEQRNQAWESIFDEFRNHVTNWEGLETFKKYQWQKQLHLYEVPFYYIEYGIAQLGAIAVWKNYKEDPEKGLQNYLNALKLGYTKSIPEIYETAGIRFDFSRDYISELIGFVKQELDKCRE